MQFTVSVGDRPEGGIPGMQPPPAANKPPPSEEPAPLPPRKLLMAIPNVVRRAATNDLEGRCNKKDEGARPWNSLTWQEKLDLVSGFVSEAEAAGSSPEEFAERRRVERGDPPFSSGGCAVS